MPAFKIQKNAFPNFSLSLCQIPTNWTTFHDGDCEIVHFTLRLHFRWKLFLKNWIQQNIWIARYKWFPREFSSLHNGNQRTICPWLYFYNCIILIFLCLGEGNDVTGESVACGQTLFSKKFKAIVTHEMFTLQTILVCFTQHRPSKN